MASDNLRSGLSRIVGAGGPLESATQVTFLTPFRDDGLEIDFMQSGHVIGVEDHGLECVVADQSATLVLLRG